MGYDPLFKINFPLEVMIEGCRKARVAGKDVTIDESMIKYCGRAVSFVQYMPAKPIKHGLKVFVLCCTVSAVWLGYKIYLGKEDTGDGSALAIVDELITEAELTQHKGRT